MTSTKTRKENLCENCETEIVDGIGCDCGDYEPETDRVAYFVERRTGYQEAIAKAEGK